MNWKERAVPVEETENSWKQRAVPVQEEPSDLEKAGNILSEEAPGLGLMAGGTIGGVLGGIPGALAGAGIGGYLGKASQNAYNMFVHPEKAPKTMSDYITQPVQEGAKSVAIEGALPLAALTPVGKAIANKMKSGAERLAFRGLGPFKKEVKRNRDRIKDIGRTALDEGVIAFPPRSAEGVEARAEGALGKAGESLGQIVDELIALEKNAIRSGVDRKKIGEQLRKKLIKKSELPTIKAENDYFNNLIKEFEEGAPFNFQNLRNEKKNVQDTINWKRPKGADVPKLEEFHRNLYTSLKNAEESGATAIAEAYPTTLAAKRFPDAKKTYGNLEEASTIAKDRADAQRANQILGLKSGIAGSAAAAARYAQTGGNTIDAVLTGLTAAIANHLAKNYGSQFSAVVLDRAAQILAKSPDLLMRSQKVPQFLPYLLHSLENRTSKDE